MSYNRLKAVQIAEDLVNGFVSLLRENNAPTPSEMRNQGYTFETIMEHYGTTYGYDNATPSIQKLTRKIFTKTYL